MKYLPGIWRVPERSGCVRYSFLKVNLTSSMLCGYVFICFKGKIIVSVFSVNLFILIRCEISRIFIYMLHNIRENKIHRP